MNTLVYVLAAVFLALQCFNIIFFPMLLGKERKPYGFREWIAQIFELVFIAIICGRIFGWW